MDHSDDTAADLSPLEQRRAALRALSDEIMETIKTLPKPQSWLEGDRAMRCLGTADRVTVQLFSKVKAPTPAERRRTPALCVRPAASVPKSGDASGDASAPVPMPVPAPIPSDASAPDGPFVYRYDDDEIDPADIPAEAPITEPLSDEARAALDLEQRANDIFAQYRAAIAAEKAGADTWNTGPP